MKSLSRFNQFVAIATLLVAALAGSPHAHAWSLAPQPVEGVLLLKNSNILHGKIQQVGQHYHVHLPNGKLQIRVSQVETVCPNIEAAYQYRRHQRGGSSADSHLELAGWCLRHELFDHAEAELNEAQAIDSDHSRLGLLRRQLTQSRQIAQRVATQASQQPEEEKEPQPVDPTELEKAPKWARALFVRQIQPLIVHSCATTGCHQSADGDQFQLNRLALDGAGHPGVTLRNLAETLKQIDFDSSQQSNLLAKARAAHGGAKLSEPLPPHKLQVLNSWVDQLAEAHQKDNALRTVPALAEVHSGPTTPTLALNPPQQSEPQPPQGVRTASYAPADPFDPSAFNAKYGDQRVGNQRAGKKETRVETPSVASATPEQSPAADPVPHVLAPSDPPPIPLPRVE